MSTDSSKYEHIVINDLWAISQRVFGPAAERRAVNPRNGERVDGWLNDHASRNFFNGHSVARLKSLLAEPRTDMVKHIEQFAQQCESLVGVAPRARRRRVSNLEIGADVNIDRWLRGDLEMFEDVKRPEQPRRRFTIGVNLSINGYEEESDLRAAAGLAAAMCESLTKRGVQVKIVAANATENCDAFHDYQLVEVVVKQFEERLDITTLSTMLGDPGFIRAAMYIGSFLEMQHPVAAGWGRAAMVKAKGSDTHAYDCLIDRDIRTVAQATAKLQNVIDEVVSRGG